MSTFELLSETMIPIFSALTGYFLGRYQHLFLERRARMTARFDNLYKPFENLYFKETFGAFHFTDLDEELRNKFLNLLFDNKLYADAKLHTLILELKWFLDPELDDKDILNDKFYEISVHISGEYNRLAKKLFYKTPKL